MSQSQTILVELAEDDCIELVASSPLGRLGVVVNGRPEIYPVNHVYDRREGCVAFPTNERTKLQAALGWPWVAFEVDGMTRDDLGGWSVLVIGSAEVVTDAAQQERLAAQRRIPWAAGDDATWLRIIPSRISGRRITTIDQ